MSRLVIASILVVLLHGDLQAQHAAAYVHSSSGTAWGQEGIYTTSMTTLFGAEWDDYVVETVDVAQLFAPDRVFVYLEGSDEIANELEVFLDAHRKTIETWVRQGGRLFVNSAPNEGDGMTFPFGVVLVYEGSGIAVAADPHDAALSGPHVVSERVYSGSGSSHAWVDGEKLTPILRDDALHCILATTRQGKGRIVYGGLTTPNYWAPSPAAQQMRENTLAWAGGRQLDPAQLTLRMKLGYPEPDESPADSLKLVVRDLALGDSSLAGAAVAIDVDGFTMTGALDAKGRSTTVIANATTKVVVKPGRRATLVVTQTHDAIGDDLQSPFLCPMDVAITVDVPITISIGVNTFHAVLPASFKGNARTTTGIVTTR